MTIRTVTTVALNPPFEIGGITELPRVCALERDPDSGVLARYQVA